MFYGITGFACSNFACSFAIGTGIGRGEVVLIFYGGVSGTVNLGGYCLFSCCFLI